VLTLTAGIKDCSASVMRRTTVPIVNQLPSWYPVPGAGWFTAPLPDAANNCVINVEFLDIDTHKVAQPNNF
jgi:hypothetical protein